MEDILLFNMFFFQLSIRALVAKIWPDKVARWCPDGDFWRLFCILCFQRAACRAVATFEATEAAASVVMVAICNRADHNIFIL